MIDLVGMYIGMMIVAFAFLIELYGIHATLKKILKKLEEK